MLFDEEEVLSPRLKDTKRNENEIGRIIVEGKVMFEVKSGEHASAAHKKQVPTYLRLTGMKLGSLLNCGGARMKEGITRTMNGTLDPDLGVSVTW